MNVIEAPTYSFTKGMAPSPAYIFMAGGITGCPDWQATMIEKLKDVEGTLFNPRRKDFDVKDPSASQIQIHWEFDHLRKADAISFWFPEESICPIALFELGAWSKSAGPHLFVGCHPGYKRLNDVVMQMRLVRPHLKVVSSLDDLIGQVREWAEL